MTTPTAAPSAPSLGTLVAAVSAFAIACGALIALYALAPHRPDVGPLFAGIPAVIAAGGSILFGIASSRRHTVFGAQLDTITHQTNGVLTAKIKAAVDSAISENITALTAQGSAVGDATDAPAPADPAPVVLAPALTFDGPPPDGGL